MPLLRHPNQKEGISGEIVLTWNVKFTQYGSLYNSDYTLKLYEDGSAECEELLGIVGDEASILKYSGGWEAMPAPRGTDRVHIYKLNMSDENACDFNWCLNESLTYVFIGKHAYRDCEDNKKTKGFEVQITSGEENFRSF